MDIASRNNFLIRAFVVIVAAVAPFIYMQYRHEEVSISEFWGSGLEPLFIFTNAATSYFFFSIEKWRPSAILLLLLTAFSVDSFLLMHNVYAVAFFVYSLIPIVLDKRLSLYAVPYLFSLVFVNWPDIFLAEVIAITSLCTFHAHLLWLNWKIAKNRKKLRNELS
jgi:hypothetical protein